jgi:clan AA aspartic protease (TIGR02281 family)
MHDKDNALKYLEKALEMGYHRFAHFERDTYLDFIRDSEGYKQLIKKYQALHEQENQPGVVTEEHSDMRVGEVPFVKDGGICKVKCQINGLPLHFVFDTGACDVSISLVEANFMMKNGYLSSSDVIGSQRFVDANGDISVGTVINLKSVDFGDFNLKNVRASVVRNQKAPLLLGQSVLSRLGRIEIDNHDQVLRITTPEGSHY